MAPECDEHLISPYNITPESDIRVMRVTWIKRLLIDKQILHVIIVSIIVSEPHLKFRFRTKIDYIKYRKRNFIIKSHPGEVKQSNCRSSSIFQRPSRGDIFCLKVKRFSRALHPKKIPLQGIFCLCDPENPE